MSNSNEKYPFDNPETVSGSPIVTTDQKIKPTSLFHPYLNWSVFRATISTMIFLAIPICIMMLIGVMFPMMTNPNYAMNHTVTNIYLVLLAISPIVAFAIALRNCGHTKHKSPDIAYWRLLFSSVIKTLMLMIGYHIAALVFFINFV